jgi:hypothetical protein
VFTVVRACTTMRLPVRSHSPMCCLSPPLPPFPRLCVRVAWVRFQRTVRRVRRSSQRRTGTATDTAETQRQRQSARQGEEEQRHRGAGRLRAPPYPVCACMLSSFDRRLCASLACALRGAGRAATEGDLSSKEEEGNARQTKTREERWHSTAASTVAPLAGVRPTAIAAVGAPTQRSSNSGQRWGENACA